jgi:glycosyltransferase involved in cell wall biosynthesis
LLAKKNNKEGSFRMECNQSNIRRVAFIGNYLPRQCGIATFTTDLCEGYARRFPDIEVFALAMNDREGGYDYPEQVRFEIQQDNRFSYERAAEYLNQNEIDIVSLQHEYGIYGGEAGDYILALLHNLRVPVVTTLHTVLRDPNAHQRLVMNQISELSDQLIVMSQRSADYLREIYHVPQEKIQFIHHGIPDLEFIDPSFHKDKFAVEGKFVVLTFGLLSENKGIEYVIQALPEVVKKYPNLVYVVVGATHPHILQREGEKYRQLLLDMAKRLGVEDHVIFRNEFVTLDELTQYISMADIYITPYLSPVQAVSGTLAYTLGSGKAVISTPYWYAEELLADGRGILVPFRSADAISEKILHLLDHEAERNAMRKRAYLYGRGMIWSAVSSQYMDAFACALGERISRPRPIIFNGSGQEDKRVREIPQFKLDHLLRMTDDTGLIQHAVYSVPNPREGYTTDDNARSLIVAVMLEEMNMGLPEVQPDLASRYLSFLWNAYNPQAGRFRNFMAYDRAWLEEIGSEDSHGRALWALGTVSGRSQREGLQRVAARLFQSALAETTSFHSPRAWAFSLLGIHEYLQHLPGDRQVLAVRSALTSRLMDLYKQISSKDWRWFENILSYDNPVLPRALIVSGQDMGSEQVTETGLESLEWLAQVQLSDEGFFAPVGCYGFYPRGGEKAHFDQQPIEAYSMVAASLDAYLVTGEYEWRRRARQAMMWFFGYNELGLPLYDPSTGGCQDGLQMDRVNQNQGAESTLSYLLSALEMRAVKNRVRFASSATPSEPLHILQSERSR